MNAKERNFCSGWKAVGRHLTFLSKGNGMIRIMLSEDKLGGSIYDEL